MSLRVAFAVAAGGAAGALLRYWVSLGVHALAGRGFPWGTLVVNVAGSLAMGVLYVALVERADLDPAWRAGLLIGLLGAFTTFSTFSIETLNLIEQGETVPAALNAAGSVALCLLACWAGIVAGRQL